MARWRVIARWPLCVLLAMALGVAGALVVLPGRIRSDRLETALSLRLGFPVRLGSARWRFDPWPAIEVRRAVGMPRVPGGWPLRIDAQRVVLRQPRLLAGWTRGRGMQATLGDTTLRLGPVVVRDARVELGYDGNTLRIAGHGFGERGGSIEARGVVGRESSPTRSLRIFLSEVDAPLFDLLGLGESFGRSEIRVTGLVRVEHGPAEEQKVLLELEAVAPREDGVGKWLESWVRGGWAVRSGNLLPDRKVTIRANLRDLGADQEVRVLQGQATLLLGLEGTARRGRLTLEGDLAGLRVRVGKVFEKAAGAPASLRGEIGWGRGEGRDLRGDLRLGGFTVRFSRRGDAEEGWTLESPRLPLRELVRLVPAVRGRFTGVEGEAAFEAHWRPGRGLEGRVFLYDLRLPAGDEDLESSFTIVRLEPGSLVIEAPDLRVAGQGVELEGELEWPAAPGRAILRAVMHAERLDLRPLLLAASRLWGPGNGEARGAEARWAAARTALVRCLRAEQRLLRPLELAAVTLTVGHLTGPGLERSQVRYRLRLVGRQLELEERGSTGRQRYAMDLGRWLPRLTAAD